MAEWTGLEPATPGVTGRYSNQLNYHSAVVSLALISKCPLLSSLFEKVKIKLKPGDVLLSHGEAPHYHRRYFVSLLSSAWKSGGSKTLWSPSKFFNLESCFFNSRSYTFNVLSLSPSKPLGCCMVKPHGQLVQVSSTPHNAYTPCLSTS